MEINFSISKGKGFTCGKRGPFYRKLRLFCLAICSLVVWGGIVFKCNADVTNTTLLNFSMPSNYPYGPWFFKIPIQWVAHTNGTTSYYVTNSNFTTADGMAHGPSGLTGWANGFIVEFYNGPYLTSDTRVLWSFASGDGNFGGNLSCTIPSTNALTVQIGVFILGSSGDNYPSLPSDANWIAPPLVFALPNPPAASYDIGIGGECSKSITLKSGTDGTASASVTCSCTSPTTTLTATANPAHKFKSWTVNQFGGGTISSTSDNPATFTFGQSNAVVTANYDNDIPCYTFNCNGFSVTISFYTYYHGELAYKIEAKGTPPSSYPSWEKAYLWAADYIGDSFYPTSPVWLNGYVGWSDGKYLANGFNDQETDGVAFVFVYADSSYQSSSSFDLIDVNETVSTYYAGQASERDFNFSASKSFQSYPIRIPWSAFNQGLTNTIDMGVCYGALTTINPSTISVVSTEHGSATASPASGMPGAKTSLAAIPSNGYSFAFWTVEQAGGGVLASSLDQNTTFTFGTSDAVVTAHFSPVCTKTGNAISDLLGKILADPLSLVAEPIDTATGAHVVHEPLLKIQGAQPLDFAIDYNSLGLSNDVVGAGWSHNYEASITPSTNGGIKLKWTANRANVFLPTATNASLLVCPDLPVIYDTLTANSDGSYTLTEPNQRRLAFDSAGCLRQVVNPHGQVINLIYPQSSSYPTQLVESVSGNYLNLAYYTNSLLSLVSDASGRFVSFDYTGNQLTSWIKGDQTGYNFNSFTYDASNRILSQINNEGYMVFTNTYDSQGRVGIQRDWQGNPTTLYYDESNTNSLVTTVVDRVGNTNIYIHDSRYQLASVTDPLHNTTSYGCDANGNRTAVTNALRRVQLYSYDQAGNLLFSVDEKSNTTWYAYDSRNNLRAITNALTNVATFDYDQRNNCTNATDFATNWIAMFYDSNSQLTNTLTQRGGHTTFSYSAGLLTCITDPNTNTTRFGYDVVGRIVVITNGAGYATSSSYDVNDYLSTVTDALSNTWTYWHDSAGRVTSIGDPLGKYSGAWYDGDGNLLCHYDSLANYSYYHYDAEDRLTNSTDANSHSTSYGYDGAGRLAFIADALNHTNSFFYDAVGNVTSTVNALGITNLITTYDERNKPTNVMDALSHGQSMVYDQLKRLTQTVDSLNRTNRFAFDSMSRLVESTDPMSFVTRQQFDSDGNRIGVTNPKTAQYRFCYDAANRLTNSSLPTQKASVYTFDSRNLAKDIQQPSGEHTSFVFDAANRFVSSTDSLSTISNVYDAKGRLRTTTENDQTLSWQYDSADRLTNYTDSASNTIRYAYDRVGNLTNLTYPGGKSVSYTYDAGNRLTQVGDWDGRITSYAYDEANRLRFITNVNHTVVARDYDDASRLTQELDLAPTSNVIYQVNYGYDAANQIVAETNQPASTPYQPTAVTMTFDADDALVTFKGRTVSNDLNGNMVFGPLTNGFGSYTYDVRNRLISAAGLNYGYDPAGNRIATTNGLSVTRFVVNPNAALSQTLMRIQNGVTNYYVYGLGLLYEVTPLNGTNRVLSYHFDYRGSTVMVSDTAGNVVDRISYSSYGEITFQSNSTDTPFLYNGRYGVMTDGNALLHMRARYYNPRICRFVNADPSGLEGGVNRYAYANGNPASLTDPFGLCAERANLLCSKVTSWGMQRFADTMEWIYGEGDAFSGGLSSDIRKWLGYDNIDYTSQAYKNGLMAGNTVSLVSAISAIGKTFQIVNGYIAGRSTLAAAEGTGGSSIAWNAVNGPGPVGANVANTFRGASYTESVLSEDTTLYRVYGGNAGPLGSYWTRAAPGGPLQSTIDSALNPAWGNTAQNVSTVVVPKGTTIYEGFAAPQGGLLGGGSQVYIPKVNPTWLVNP